MTKYEILKRTTLVLLFAILLGFFLIEAREFLYPIFIAVLVAYLLYPLARKLEDWKLPRILAILFSLLLAIAFFFGVLYLLYRQLSVFLEDFPALKQQALKNIEELEVYVTRKFGIRMGRQKHFLRDQVTQFFAFGGTFLNSVLTATTSSFIKIVIIPVYVFLFLFYRNKFRMFIIRLLPSEEHPHADLLMQEIAQVTRRFMTGIVTVVFILCFVNTAGLLLLDVRYALLFGILSAMMNIIPYLGTLIGGSIPLLFTLLIEGDPKKALGVLVLFLSINFVENNILTPNITGGQVQINPLFIILGLIAGGMVWGLPGMFVVIPFLGMFKVYCDHVASLQPYAFLMGIEGTEQHSFSIKKIKAFFSRLRGKKSE